MAMIQIGDIVEIKTSKGLAYALYSHRHSKPPRFGAMLRVFEGLFQARPHNLLAIAELPIQFTTFFPLQAAVDQQIVEVIGNVSIPDNLRIFPIFRNAMVDPRTKKVAAWWLWDGEKEWPIGELTPELLLSPILGVWNDTMLVQRIESGWRPGYDPN